MIESPGRGGGEDGALLGGGPVHKARFAVGVGMGVLISLAASVTLVLGHTLFAVPGYGEDATLWVVFFGLVLACALATPVAVLLGKAPGGRAGGGPGLVGARRSVGPGGPASIPAGARLNERQAERRLLEAIERHGEITPVRAALETPLTVAEADRMLSELASGGHLEVRVEGGKLLYGL